MWFRKNEMKWNKSTHHGFQRRASIVVTNCHMYTRTAWYQLRFIPHEHVNLIEIKTSEQCVHILVQCKNLIYIDTYFVFIYTRFILNETWIVFYVEIVVVFAVETKPVELRDKKIKIYMASLSIDFKNTNKTTIKSLSVYNFQSKFYSWFLMEKRIWASNTVKCSRPHFLSMKNMIHTKTL